MKKKAFTLIELLGVIILLGIILLIAIPAITKYLKIGTNKYYNNVEEVLVAAGRDYISDYDTLLPREIGNVTILSLNELVSNKYLDKVVDSKGNSCEAKVAVKKVAKKEYEYYSCLICEDYQSEGDNCGYSEDTNITSETKNYSIEVEKDHYTINQGEPLTLPYAKAYYLGELVSSIVSGNPNQIDTNKVGTTTVTYAFRGAKKDVIVDVIDTVKPSIPEVTLKNDSATGNAYNGKWYSGDIYAEFLSTDYTKPGIVGSGINYYELSKNGTTWEKVNSNYLFTESGEFTYYIRSVDKSGNVSETNSFTVKIDNETPQCNILLTGTSGTNGWYTSNVTAELEIQEVKSGILTNAIDKTSITNNTTGTTITGIVTSVSGKVGTCTKTVKIDKVIPSAPQITASDSIASNNWHKTNFNLTLSGANNISGNNYKYGTTSNPGTTGTNISLTTNTSGTTYYAKVCSNAGLCGVNASYIVKLDTVIPQCSIALTGTSGTNGWYTSNVTATLEPSELVSGVAASNLDKTSITSNTTGETVTGIVTDNAGNIGTCSITVKVDKTTPSAPTVTASDSKASNTWHSADFTLNFSGESNVSGNTYYYGTTTSPSTAGTSTSVSGNTSGTTYYAKVCSGSGLCSSNASYIVKIDKTNPTVSYNIGGGTYTTAQTITVTGSDTNFSYMNVHVYKDGVYQSGKSTEGRTSNTFAVSLDSAGTWTVYTQIYDQSGRRQSQSPDNGGGWYYQNYTIQLCAYAVNTYWDFGYIGWAQGYTVPCNGTYKLEVWGAQGGSSVESRYAGGKGGQASGSAILSKNSTIYVVVGSTGASGDGSAPHAGGYNGGGAGGEGAGGGGGATHIGTFNNTLAGHGSTSGLYIVAGGGGGSDYESWSCGYNGYGGTGGGTNGGDGTSSCTYDFRGGGASQSGPGLNHGAQRPGFGQGGGTLGELTSGGGGGGLYGGGAGSMNNGVNGGGGGSGYVGGVTGGSMQNGTREGNGFARITLTSITN